VGFEKMTALTYVNGSLQRASSRVAKSSFDTTTTPPISGAQLRRRSRIVALVSANFVSQIRPFTVRNLAQRTGQRDMPTVIYDVCFSNRPVGVKRFQTIHNCGVDVTRGLVLLYGIGT
jgi:hypothetical protein